ncbi:MAG: HAMP domain-containing protein [Chloroflexi bacterium]|nr:MAG: HAMP domain-containing protein [Chloroflexota bacterium]
MNPVLHRLDRWLPRRLTSRITLALVVIVVLAGLITTGAINWLVGHNLREELIASGEALTLALGENLANALIESDLATVQESLDSVVSNNDDVVYAFAFGLDSPIVHTFPNGFPADLLHTIPATAQTPGEGVLLRTEQGMVRDFGYRPLDGLPAEVHLGISQARIGRVQAQVTSFVFILTVAGCLAAAVVAYGFSRMVTFPLVELTRRVKRLGSGHLDERIDLPPGDEVGDLAAAFNHMAADIQTAIHQLQVSEAGYRDLLTAAGTVGEGIALICDEGENEGTFLFVNEAFAHLAGFQPADLVGVNAASILHPDSLAAARRNWQAIRAGNSRSPYELTLIDRHNQPHILETTGTIIEYQGKRALVWFTRDISERKAREKELRRRNRELTALNAVASAASEPLPPDEILNRALHQVLTALDLETGWIFIRTGDGDTKLAASHGLAAGGATFAFPDCACGQVLTEGNPAVVTAANPNCVVRYASAIPPQPLAYHATVPLKARGQTVGALSVAAGSLKAFDEAEMALLATVGQQIGVALENARLWEEVRQREQVRGELLKRIISAQEEERRCIARELHDGIGQSLNALVFGLNTVDASLQQKSEQVPTQIARLKISASDTVKELQNIIYDLRPSLLDDLGLVMALRWYAQERLQAHGVQVTFDVPQQGPRLPQQIETALFRIGQEAMTNIGKHAQARHVTISLQIGPEDVRLEITDDGVGFALNALAGQDGRPAWGLLGMQERANLLGGELAIESEPGQGVRLSVTLPLGDNTG